jgi:hypothetical protein
MAYQGKSRRSRIVKVVAATLAVVALTGAQKSCQTTARSGSATAKVESTAESTAESNGKSSAVVYSVTSDARIKSVTFLDTDGNKVTRTNVGSSWSGSGPSEHGTVLISATTGDGSSMIRCSVKVRGKVVQRASAVGGGSTTVVCRASY